MYRKLISFKQPKEMYVLAAIELCQRFVLWGIAFLLVLFLVQSQGFSDGKADEVFGVFTGAAFALPILGGYIGDRLKHRIPIVLGCIFNALGSFLIATGLTFMIYVGLGFIAIGSSLFTPSIYTLLGNLYHNKHEMREGGFTIYYALVNLGVFIAVLVLGFLGHKKLWSLAFVIAGLVQLAGLYLFYKTVKISSTLMNVSAKRQEEMEGLKKAPFHKKAKDRILVILALSFFSILFWMAYNQGASSMSLFALRYTDKHIFGWDIPPAWLVSSESLYLVLLAIPLAYFYQRLSKKRKDPSPPMKCAISLFSIGLCFVIMTIGSYQIPSGAVEASLSPGYLLFAYFFMALGEMLLCPIGLSLITHLSPHKYTALLVGAWYFCIGIAFYFGGMMATLMEHFKISEFFNIFVIAALVPAIILLLLAKKLDQMRHVESL